MGKLPTVAIVGRPNVGKSALFNRLVQRRVAIVHDQPGVTRDRLTADSHLGKQAFTVIDTGGLGSHIGDQFDQQVRAEAQLAIDFSDLILLVTDGREGLNPIDLAVAKDLRGTGKTVLLVVNKIDHQKHHLNGTEFIQLGFGEPFPVSAAHGTGIVELVAEIEKHLPFSNSESQDNLQPLKLAIVGRPNVGKSSLINAILQDQRTIVSRLAGTTRDAVDIPYERDGKHYILIDTAGIRARGKHNSSVEVFSVMRSEKSLEKADICALVIDAVDGVTAQDKKIAGLIQQNEKPCLVAVNKLDLVKPPACIRDFFNGVLGQIRANLFFLDYAPIDILSAETRENLDRFFLSIEKIRKHSRKTIGTGVLNRLLKDATETQPPPMRGGKRLNILYATQVSKGSENAVSPPTFALFVNYPDLLTESYLRYLEGKIRERMGYHGLPILFRIRSRRS
ncbi:MAG: ribosome biogenesis GTPase Der [Verrucomicrobia bacterium]|nr:ribosome biogenesis GTPase Der [Verrucomicrobiota bacterium]